MTKAEFKGLIEQFEKRKKIAVELKQKLISEIQNQKEHTTNDLMAHECRKYYLTGCIDTLNEIIEALKNRYSQLLSNPKT